MAAQVLEEGGRLKVTKDTASNLRTYGIVTGVGIVGLLIGILSLFTIFPVGIVFILVSLLFIIIGGQQIWRLITKGEYSVFDRQVDSFSQNDKLVAKLSDLKGIQLQHYSRLNPQGKPYFHRYFVYMVMTDGKQIEVDNSADPTMAAQIATPIATYLGFNVEQTEEIRREGTTQPTA